MNFPQNKMHLGANCGNKKDYQTAKTAKKQEEFRKKHCTNKIALYSNGLCNIIDKDMGDLSILITYGYKSFH